MKITKEEANVLGMTIGKVIAGTVLMGVGFVTAVKGALTWGSVGMALGMYDAAPEEYQKIADKIKED